MKFSALVAAASAHPHPVAELIFGADGFNDRVEPVSNSTGVPLAMFHGFGDACLNPGIHQIDKLLSDGIGAPVECFESGLPSLGEVFANFERVAENSCKKLASKDFAGEFDVIGLSQGGLLARWIVEKCDMPGKVRKMVTLGGPHMGVDAVPHCLSGPLCNVVNDVARKLVYLPIAQNHLSPAGYFRDVQNWSEYTAKSVFLASLNNEAPNDTDPKRKERFSALEGMFLVKWTDDTMIYPRETAWFQSLDSDAKNVLPLNQTEFYTNDRIGLKGLNEANKVKFVEWPGQHLQITDTQLKTEVIPFLLA